jgi:hypothetical protein
MQIGGPSRGAYHTRGIWGCDPATGAWQVNAQQHLGWQACVDQARAKKR